MYNYTVFRLALIPTPKDPLTSYNKARNNHVSIDTCQSHLRKFLDRNVSHDQLPINTKNKVANYVRSYSYIFIIHLL